MPPTTRPSIGTLKLLLVGALFFGFGLAAQAQAIQGLETAGLVRTEHFEIYHSRGTADQALRLSGFADAVLADIEAVFGNFSPSGRIPILVTDIQPELNGYATPYPSNRIVLYLAEPDLRDSLATFDDELKMVFIHELVHMVNMNERAPFWKFVAAIAGDVVSPPAWTMPYALLEGTAVWMESRIDEGVGRLNDPAALETVRIDLVQGLRRSIWDVSGVLEYPGSGSLPYIYGGLFVEYFVERFGTAALAELWRVAGEGNIFKGFEAASGDMWNGFLDWAHLRLGIVPQAPNGSDNAASSDTLLLSGRFGPVASDGKSIFFLDHSRKAVFAWGQTPDEGAKRLFAADSFLTDISLADGGRTLDLEWLRTDAAGRRKSQHYEYSLDDHSMRLSKQEVGTTDPEWTYGLQRIGSKVVPSRVSAGGDREYIDFPEGSLRSLKPEGQTLFALSYTPPGSASKIAVLRQAAGNWELLVQKSAPSGGGHSPVFVGSGKIAYIAWLTEGRQELRLLDFAAALESGEFPAREAAWLPFPALESKTPETDKFPINGASELFPRVLSSARYPYMGNNSAGIAAQGSDITERLSWEARAGWEFDSGIPETSLEIRLATSGHGVNLTMSDSSVPSSGGFARVSGASIGWNYGLSFLPVRRRAGVGLFASASGVDDAYSLPQWLSPSWDHSSLGGGMSLYYSDMAYDTFAPFDTRGSSLSLIGDFEQLPGITQAMSISGSISLASARPSLKLSFYGAYSPPGGVLFLPSGRYFNAAGTSRGSAIPIRYPSFDEYSAIIAGSPWYGYAELSARMLSIETGRIMKPLRIPFLLPWTLRRFSIVAGARAAAMDMSSTTVLPASGFLRLETDSALLLGFASQSHIAASVEAAYAFDTVLAGGNPLFISFGLGVWY